MQKQAGGRKLRIKNGRYVCPYCGTTMNQQARLETKAENLVLWCWKCKAEIKVNIDSGQCFVIASAR